MFCHILVLICFVLNNKNRSNINKIINENEIEYEKEGVLYKLNKETKEGRIFGFNQGIIFHNLIFESQIIYESNVYTIVEISDDSFYECYNLIGSITIPNTIRNCLRSIFLLL